MATKGPSNRYGNSRGGSSGHESDSIGFAWAKDFNKNTLSEHYKNHGTQVKSDTINSYIAHAIKFANTIDRKNCVSFIDRNGSTYKYNKKTDELVIVTKKGYVVTYFKPSNGYKYYRKQKNEKRKKKHDH
ncbi:hypothetical protein [Allobaculum stercoricanis]|uniref:hypothetical protein n=1 Tax=Allobaculum stercoricanis TaxID=174709 RepID=UPI0023F3C6CC|nr:hypothetical protein [Allobaculum stercoricanis]